ncbi:hypothetical protein N8I77_011660 [Diaporthe amygdali]|uniref:Tyrosinase copper-binding domain-containing protein n=1 Tax=Phomopsis amygdali TaxID=1214568 RepID=A0AAD9S354_PHOAM|nr:hypothetical protein N8I77_011660 [Diaporthe amygdali]
MGKFLHSLATAISGLQAVSAACTNPSQRKSWSTLTTDEKTDYINSTLCLMDPDMAPAKTGLFGSKSRWDEIQVTHVAQVQFIHTVGAFFPWHRWYMTVHENLLRNECGYTGPLPYWDEQKDQATLPLVEVNILSPSATTGFGNTTDENGCVVDGPFTGLRPTLQPNLTRTAEEGTCLQRDYKQAQFDLVSQDIVDSCFQLDQYSDLLNCLGGTPHTSGHYAIGGTMDSVSLSPADPLFFLHHTNLDRLWWEWQSQNSSRLTDMGGKNVATATSLVDLQPSDIYNVDSFLPYFGDNGNVTTLNHVLWMTGLADNVTIAEVMDINSDLICAEYV